MNFFALEQKAYQMLSQKYTPQESEVIFRKFIHEYKYKHLDELINQIEYPKSHEWFKKRQQTMTRYFQLYYLRNTK